MFTNFLTGKVREKRTYQAVRICLVLKPHFLFSRFRGKVEFRLEYEEAYHHRTILIL